MAVAVNFRVKKPSHQEEVGVESVAEPVAAVVSRGHMPGRV